MKKVLCVLLSLCLIFSFCAPAFAVKGGEKAVMTEELIRNENPLVVVRGMDFSGGLAYDRGTENEKIVGAEFTAQGIIKTLFSAFGALISKFSFTAGIDVILDYLRSLFDGYACDENGDSLYDNVSAKSYPLAAGNYEEFNRAYGGHEDGFVRAAVSRYGGDKVYYFVYDWRLDPAFNAGKLNDMINTALSECGAEKVNLVCCSMGGIVALTYLSEYTSAKVASFVANSSAIYGADVASELLCGNFAFEPAAVSRYLSSFIPRAKGAIVFLEKTGVLSIVCRLLTGFAEKYKDRIYEKVLTPVFGTMPALWALVQPDAYEQAKSFIFGENTAKYAGLIEKTDKLQRETISNRDEILRSAVSSGMHFAAIANYNTPLACVYPSASKQGDGTLETGPMSLGALTSELYGVLSDKELSVGDSKYISADKCINASTCLFPDYTWFVKNAEHVACEYGSDYTEFVFILIESEDQISIDSFSEYPQFMIEIDYALYPLSSHVEQESSSGGIC